MKFRKISMIVFLITLLLSACSSSDNSSNTDNPNNQLPTPVILDYMLPAAEIEVGEVAIIVLDEPMLWQVTNNSAEIVELQDAVDDGTMQTNYAVTGLALGTANLYAEKDGLGQSFTVEVVAKKTQRTLQIADSDFSLTLPGFLADRIEFVIEMGEIADQLEAVNASYIYFKAEDGQPRFGSFAWVLPVAKWEEIQNPNEPPLGDEMLRVENLVLVVSGPQDLPFNDRYSNDANRYGALATLLDIPETYSHKR